MLKLRKIVEIFASYVTNVFFIFIDYFLKKVRGVFPVRCNGKNATNFFPHLIYLINYKKMIYLLEIKFYLAVFK